LVGLQIADLRLQIGTSTIGLRPAHPYIKMAGIRVDLSKSPGPGLFQGGIALVEKAFFILQSAF